MIVLAAIVVAVLLLAPSHAASAPPPVVVAPITSASSAADAAPIPAPEVGTLMTQGSLADVIDMVPGKPPTPRYPAGTMFVGSVVDDGDRGPAAKLYEWDVARAAIVDVRTIRLDDANGKIDPGAPSAIRLAKDGDQVISVVEASGGAHALSAEGWVHSMGSRASIAGERGLVAVAYYEGTSRALEIELFHPSFYGADVLGHTRLDGGDRVAAGQRPAALTFLHGRLYVATRPNAFETVVAELQIPSLRVLGTFRHRRESTKHARSQLFARDERLYLLDRGELVELPPHAIGAVDYKPRMHDVDADEVAVHSGRFLTTGGLNQTSMRGDFVPALGASGSCTPAWSPDGVGANGAPIDASPMLACSVAGGGVRVVRLPRAE